MNNPEKLCACGCGRLITSGRSDKMYFGPQCSRKVNHVIRNKRRQLAYLARPTITCACGCGQSFVRWCGQKYYSDECFNKYHRRQTAHIRRLAIMLRPVRYCGCGCGCGRVLAGGPTQRFFSDACSQRNRRKAVLAQRPPVYCLCGCGNRVEGNNKKKYFNRKCGAKYLKRKRRGFVFDPDRKCACGCGRPLNGRIDRKWFGKSCRSVTDNSYKRQKRQDGEKTRPPVFCKCGCGGIVKWPRREYAKAGCEQARRREGMRRYRELHRKELCEKQKARVARDRKAFNKLRNERRNLRRDGENFARRIKYSSNPRKYKEYNKKSLKTIVERKACLELLVLKAQLEELLDDRDCVEKSKP